MTQPTPQPNMVSACCGAPVVLEHLFLIPWRFRENFPRCPKCSQPCELVREGKTQYEIAKDFPPLTHCCYAKAVWCTNELGHWICEKCKRTVNYPESLSTPELEKAITEILAKPPREEKRTYIFEICCSCVFRDGEHIKDCPCRQNFNTVEPDWEDALKPDVKDVGASLGVYEAVRDILDEYWESLMPRVSILRSQWEAAAENRGYERGKSEVQKWLDEMVIKLDEARAEAVREFAEKYRHTLVKKYDNEDILVEDALKVLAFLQEKGEK